MLHDAPAPFDVRLLVGEAHFSFSCLRLSSQRSHLDVKSSLIPFLFLYMFLFNNLHCGKPHLPTHYVS